MSRCLLDRLQETGSRGADDGSILHAASRQQQQAVFCEWRWRLAVIGCRGAGGGKGMR